VRQVPESQEKALYLECQRSLQEIFGHCRAGNLPDVPVVRKTARKLAQSIGAKPQLWRQLALLKDADPYSAVHSVNVCIFAIFLGLRAGYRGEVLEWLAAGALLHDIGKLEVPLEVLNKPGRLEPEEFSLIKEHPRKGCRRLEGCGTEQAILLAVLGHHERGDGSGYPLGLRLTAIPEIARIIAVADVYDALTTDRAYRARLLPHDGLETLLAEASKGKLDRRLVRLFASAVAPYPVGTVLRLSGGEVGEVVRVPPELPFRPVLRLLEPPERHGQTVELASSLSLVV
jgi:HD-GYP domain-containing protein (c-di-GMP phosphodiesterase class II)